MLSVHPSGFYAWVKEPLSQRALEDRRQTKLVKKAWNDSGKVYGYRKIHDDLIDMGEAVSENRVGRLTRDLPPKAPSFITRVCGSEIHILRRQFGQARRARSRQIAQASGALLRAFYFRAMNVV